MSAPFRQARAAVARLLAAGLLLGALSACDFGPSAPVTPTPIPTAPSAGSALGLTPVATGTPPVATPPPPPTLNPLANAGPPATATQAPPPAAPATQPPANVPPTLPVATVPPPAPPAAPAPPVAGATPRWLVQSQPGDLKSPAWSPDGTHLAYVQWAEQSSDIYTIAALGGPATRIATGGFNAAPAWGPAGIAFAGNRDGNFDLYLMDPTGANVRRLTNNPAYEVNPTWSPDGQHLAYLGEQDGRIWIFTLALTPGAQPQLVATADQPYSNGTLAWSPDGSRFAFVVLENQVTNVETVAVDGSDPRRLTNYADPQTTAGNPIWGPNGSVIYVVQDEHGTVQRLVARQADGRQIAPLLPPPSLSPERFPALAPGTSTLAFISDQAGAAGLYLIDLRSRLP
jgi:Tol biopolymer transport system component